ncbi:MAG: D-alanyl-D-alanine carboxypeptidase/D-alanyl-D-alanine endopeptidase [Candidatus Fervidibacter sp.]|uniref:D-alanyl-D-alanine carboxypeptidase/D-alanyl-D-alanine endopeptidase n=1 Tax=Candidatus Fervidibacter sp. TaxID=3100871 RepID=UPI00404A2C36
MRKALTVMITVFAVSVCVFASQENPLETMLSDSTLAGAWVGVFVQTADNSPQTLFNFNENKRFMPASNTKLFTAALVLEKLGPEFTFTTPVLMDGTVEGESLTGNLYLKGTGDPSLSRDRLKELAKAISAKGIRSVKGDIIVDVSAFTDNRWGAGWSWDYLHYGYAPEVWSVALDRNSVTVQISPSSDGQLAKVVTVPMTNWLIIDNRIITAKSGEPQWSVWRDSLERTVHFWGRIPLNSPPTTVRISIPSVPHYVGEVFREILTDSGVTVLGKVRVGHTPRDAVVIAETKSPPLRELVRWLNKVSDNLYAEMLIRSVALKEKGQASLRDALRILTGQLIEWGIEASDVQIVDGSGLSRLNAVTPRSIVRLLQVARTRPWFDAFKNSLPVAGRDGTLQPRFKGTPGEGMVFAKTGYIGSVAALSGYIQCKDGGELVFSVLVNHYNTSTRRVQASIDKFVIALAEGGKRLLESAFTSSASSN